MGGERKQGGRAGWTEERKETSGEKRSIQPPHSHRLRHETPVTGVSTGAHTVGDRAAVRGINANRATLSSADSRAHGLTTAAAVAGSGGEPACRRCRCRRRRRRRWRVARDTSESESDELAPSTRSASAASLPSLSSSSLLPPTPPPSSSSSEEPVSLGSTSISPRSTDSDTPAPRPARRHRLAKERAVSCRSTVRPRPRVYGRGTSPIVPADTSNDRASASVSSRRTRPPITVAAVGSAGTTAHTSPVVAAPNAWTPISSRVPPLAGDRPAAAEPTSTATCTESDAARKAVPEVRRTVRCRDSGDTSSARSSYMAYGSSSTS